MLKLQFQIIRVSGIIHVLGARFHANAYCPSVLHTVCSLASDVHPNFRGVPTQKWTAPRYMIQPYTAAPNAARGQAREASAKHPPNQGTRGPGGESTVTNH